jgi:cell wall-associated NlpC family hydrolase
VTGVLNAAERLRPSAVGETKVGHRQSTSKGRDVLTGKKLSSVLLAIIFIILSSLAASAGTIAYKVKKGDTLWAIAKKYHTTPKQIAKANGISENATLALGKSLRIPSKYSAAKPRTTVKQSQDVGYAVYTKADNVCLRKGPGTDSAKISVLPAGTTGKVLSTKGTWAKIALSDGTCGYVYRPLMAKGQPANSKPVQMACATSSANNNLIQTALACRGARYRRGGTSRGGFDCSGFTRYVFAKYGVSLPHSSAAQARMGTSVSRSELKSGDLVFFQTYRRGISHVGIYVSNGQFVHAARYGRGVRVDSLDSGYYSARYRCARRVK